MGSVHQIPYFSSYWGFPEGKLAQVFSSKNFFFFPLSWLGTQSVLYPSSLGSFPPLAYKIEIFPSVLQDLKKRMDALQIVKQFLNCSF